MTRSLIPRPDDDDSRPLIEVMPHLSAPIDDHPIIPKPPWRWWERAMLAMLLVMFALAVMLFAFFRATAL